MRITHLLLATVFSLLGVLTVESSWAGSNDFLTRVVGGAGGEPFGSTCQEDYYLAGLEVRYGNWIDAVGLNCGKWETANQTLRPGFTSPLWGGSGGASHRMLCDLDEAVGGLTVQRSANNFLGFLLVGCRRVKTPRGHLRWQLGGFGKVSFKGHHRSQQLVCPDGQVATGIHGASGHYVDRIGLVCAAAPKLDSLMPKPGAGSPGGTPYGQIGKKYAALGGARSALGPSVGNETGAPHGGRCQSFRHGAICWHPEIGEAFAVWGLIGEKWSQLGRAGFGYPITDEQPTSDGHGRFNHFRGMQHPGRPESSIYWTPQTGAHAIHGLIRDAWVKQGRERGPLGYPISDEHKDDKFRRVNFERGHILWASDTGIQIFR